MANHAAAISAVGKTAALFLLVSLCLTFSLCLSICASSLSLWITLIEQLITPEQEQRSLPNIHTHTHTWTAVLIILVDKSYRAQGSSAAAPRCLCPALLSGQWYVWHDGATPKNSPGACE